MNPRTSRALPRRKLYENFFKIAMQECLLDIHLRYRPPIINSYREENSYSGYFDNWIENLLVINTKFLSKTLSNKICRSIVPSDLNFVLNTQQQPTTCLPWGKETILQVLFSAKAVNLSSIAFLQIDWVCASWKLLGSWSFDISERKDICKGDIRW